MSSVQLNNFTINFNRMKINSRYLEGNIKKVNRKGGRSYRKQIIY